ncbi:hypothetical protein GYMLUDRAFT_61814 [Collybiopsis luxurians FD-317 M1]|uniref:Nucleoplasmin-like domain-containing protein n=1 Tax=Collybiopsis luxurians FD-317 M1 TaxID=944289 RepID=A0A0D0CFA3_9AGAR|nr:hypothetical protein GYMLUDRAFT_61814 [Collybiopsis luxurians FD-317 M1]
MSWFIKLAAGQSFSFVLPKLLCISTTSIEPDDLNCTPTTLTLSSLQHNELGFQVLMPLKVCTFRSLEAETFALDLRIGKGQKITAKASGPHKRMESSSFPILYLLFAALVREILITWKRLRPSMEVFE